MLWHILEFAVVASLFQKCAVLSRLLGTEQEASWIISLEMVGVPLSRNLLPFHGVKRIASSAPGPADYVRAFPIGFHLFRPLSLYSDEGLS